jgi:hypothetical protein
VLRFLLWRLLGLLAFLAGLALLSWFIRGGPGRLLRGQRTAAVPHALASSLLSVGHGAGAIWAWSPPSGVAPARLTLLSGLALLVIVVLARTRARGRRCYVRSRVDVYRGDHASPQDLVTMFGALHKRLLRRWWRRLLIGQPSLSLEVHSGGGAAPCAWLAVSCPREQTRMNQLSSARPARNASRPSSRHSRKRST